MKQIKDKKTANRLARHSRIRSRVFGTADKPRLAVFRSNKYVYAQIVDDSKGKTLFSVSSLKMKKPASLESAKEVGQSIAKLAVAGGVKKAVFDRGGFLYTGKIKALADAAREGGLEF